MTWQWPNNDLTMIFIYNSNVWHYNIDKYQRKMFGKFYILILFSFFCLTLYFYICIKSPIFYTSCPLLCWNFNYVLYFWCVLFSFQSSYFCWSIWIFILKVNTAYCVLVLSSVLAQFKDISRLVTDLENGYRKDVLPTTTTRSYVAVKVYPAIVRIDDLVRLCSFSMIWITTYYHFSSFGKLSAR